MLGLSTKIHFQPLQQIHVIVDYNFNKKSFEKIRSSFPIAGCSDWGTGIPQKVCRVGSPTSFSNPNINIPGNTDDWVRLLPFKFHRVNNIHQFLQDEYFSGASNDEEEENFRKVLKSKSRRNKGKKLEEGWQI